MAKDADAMLTIGDVAQRTGRAPSTLRFWESRGEIPAAVRTPQGLRLWKGSDLDLIQSRSAQRRAERGAAA